MGEYIGLFGHVADVKAVKSLGVCRVVVEVPIEQHKAVTNGFWDADVLITLSDGKQGYGMARSGGLPETERDWGQAYRELYRQGFFNNPALWRWAGGDADYQAWCRGRKSVVSGRADWADGVARCEYAHVRRVAAGAGVGIKPEYSGVPLTHAEHALQHSQGEAALLAHYGIRADDAAGWFENKAAECRTEWVKSRLYAHFGVGSLKEVAPADFAAWAQGCGLPLPAAFRGAGGAA